MKKSNSSIIVTAITTAVCVLSGALLLSCSLPVSGGYGTLVIALPGGTAQAGARAAVSGAFSATLTYRIDCDGPGGRITRHGQAGASLSIPLNAGEWAITVTVFNAADQSIGGGAATALIESGATTALRIPVAIDTSGNDITGFALTSPVSALGSIAPGSTAIAVSVPFGTDLSAAHFTATHTGASLSPSPGTVLNFSSPQTFTVTAENGQTKTYTVTITPADNPAEEDPPTEDPPTEDPSEEDPLTEDPPTEDPPTEDPPEEDPPTEDPPTEDPPEEDPPEEDPPEEDPPVGGAAVWPSSGTWQAYGLSAITQPGGTTVSTAGVSSGALIVSLQNADITAFNDLIAQIETLSGVAGATSGDSGYSIYELAYDLSGERFALSMTHTPSGMLILNIEPDDPGGFLAWPGDSRWTAFNLSGLTQPALTTIGDVTETESPYAMLSVTLNSITNAAYEDLLSRITALLGNPLTSTGGGADPTREDVFMTTAGGHSITVALSMDLGYDEILVTAVKY